MKEFRFPNLLPEPIIVQIPESHLLQAFVFNLKHYRYYLQGLEKARKSRIVIVGCVRDIDPIRLHTNLAKCKNLGEKFADYHIVLVDNDSQLEFYEQLENAKNGLGDKFTCLSKRYGYDRLGDGRDLKRVSIMAQLRNLYIAEIKEKHKDFDYVMVIDPDIADWRMNGVLNSLGHDGWDMIGANGIQMRTKDHVYYDTFALIEKTYNTFGKGESKEAIQFNTNLIRVISCFGGIGLYKTKALLAAKKYQVYRKETSYLSEQCGIHLNMAVAGHDKIFINPNMVVIR
jgi:hypothetical protein